MEKTGKNEKNMDENVGAARSASISFHIRSLYYKVGLVWYLWLESIIVFSYQIMLKPMGRKSFTAQLIRMLDQKVNKFFKGNE